MNEHDRSNLEFLRSLNDAGLERWFKSSSEDDLSYASKLLQAWEAELEVEALELLDSIDDVDIAITVLSEIFKN